MNPHAFDALHSPFAPALRAARAGRTAEALAAISSALSRLGAPEALVPDAASALGQVAKLSEAAGDPAGAREAVVAALRLQPHWPDLLVLEARLLLAGPCGPEARAEARAALDLALETNPSFTEARLERALLDASEGLIGEALEALRALATEARIEEPRAFEQGLESLERAEWEEAAKLLHRALPPEGASVEAAITRARERMEHGEPEAAARLLRSELADHSGHPDLHLLLGSAEFRAGHLDDALVSFAGALALHPDLHAARVEFARVLEALGQSTQAVEQVRLVLEQEPAHPKARELAVRWARHRAPATRAITARNPS